MIQGPLWQQVLSWVLTYLAHSTVLLGTAWLLTRVIGSERLRAQERIWKTALIGGLLTATVQVAFDIAPIAGRFDLGPVAETAAIDPPDSEPVPLPGAAGEVSTAGFAQPFSWQQLLLGCWIAGGSLGVILLLFAWRRVADFLAGRRRLRRGPAWTLLRRLSREAGLRRAPRLTASHRLRSPATVGVFAPQICIPYRALTELPPDQQEALLAHELAHIVRRDPLWFLVCRLIERVLFFQPLNSLACRECQEIAEFLSDDWAAQRTRRELSLARCLTEVATWVLDLRPVVAVVPMASRNSRLAARIERLLDEQRTPQDHGRRPSGLILPGMVLLAGLLSMPGAAAIADPDPVPEVAPTPEPPPSLSLAGNRELTELLELLDREVEALASEVERLGTDLQANGPSPRQADSFRQLGERVAGLRGRRAELHRLVPALLGAPPDRPQRTPISTDNLLQE